MNFSIPYAGLTTSVATICHRTTLLQYHSLFSLCCAFIPGTYSFRNWKPVSSPPPPIPNPFPLVTRSLFSVFIGLILLFVYSFVLFFRFHMSEISFQSDLLYLAYVLDLSTLLQMTRVHPSYGCVIFHWIILHFLKKESQILNSQVPQNLNSLLLKPLSIFYNHFS